MSSKFSKIKNNQVSKMSKSDADFYKMSGLFFILCAVILYVVKIMNTANHQLKLGDNLAHKLFVLFSNPVYIAVIAVLTVASAVWFVFKRIKKADESRSLFSSINALVVMLYISGFSAFYGTNMRTNPSDSVFVIVVTVILALLYYIYKIYHMDFFLFSVENAVMALLLYRYADVTGAVGIVGKVLLIIAAALLGYVFVKKSSKLHSRLTSSPFVAPYFVTLAIWAVLMFVGNVADVTAGIRLTVMLVQYIVFSIIYTIKLIKE